jgi:hypothetical protein
MDSRFQGETTGLGRRMLGAALIAVLALLAPSLVAAPAFAHSRDVIHPQAQTASGFVTGFDGHSLQIQTPDGLTITARVTSATHVIREVTGSTADLSVGEVVDLYAERGQTDVATVHVCTPRTTLPPARPRRGLKASHARPAGRVQIAGLTDSTITVRYPDGTTATYALSDDVQVRKDVPGTLTDLAVGEMVSIVFRPRTTIASQVMILAA